MLWLILVSLDLGEFFSCFTIFSFFNFDSTLRNQEIGCITWYYTISSYFWGSSYSYIVASLYLGRMLYNLYFLSKVCLIKKKET